MNAIVDSFFPLIALIGLGWLCRRRGFIGPAAARELTLFVVWLALPSLLFEAIANASLRELWQPQFVVACGVSMIVPFVVVTWWQPKSLDFVDRCLDGFGATYANSGFIGIPLSALLLGKDALIPATIMVLMTAVLVFAVGIVLLEIGGGTAASPMASVRKAARAVARKGLKTVPKKALLSLRIDSDVIAWFRKQGAGYQSRMNALLRAYMEAHQ